MLYYSAEVFQVIIIVLLFTESTVEIKAVYNDELDYVAYGLVNISSGLTCVNINSWPCV